MALKDLYKMAKADKYTQDGRDKIIKAQNGIADDAAPDGTVRHWKSGDHVKQGGKWVPVKNAKAAGAKTGSGKTSGSGVPIQGSNWMSLPSGTRVTNEGAREKMAKNNERIETIKKLMEGNTKAGNFRLGSELKSLQNENEYIASRLPPEKSESKPAESKPKRPKPTAEEYFKAKDRVEAYEKQFKKEMDDYEYMQRIKANGVDTSIFNPMFGGKPKPLTENESYMEELEKVKAYEAEDAAPRVLTGDTKIKVRK